MFNIADISGCISGLDRHRRDDEVYPFFFFKKIIIILKKVLKKFGGIKNMLYLCSVKVKQQRYEYNKVFLPRLWS